jgi:type I restriction enzyme R subunit
MKLLIVVDKLLTGFDAPSATYLYIDKQMRDHGLFQAICRVNRLDGDDKEYGYVIDYKDLFKSLEGAVKDYTSGALDHYAKEDVEGLLKDRVALAKEHLQDALEAARALVEPVETPKDTAAYMRYFCTTASGDAAQLKDNEPKRVALYKSVSALLRAFAAMAGDEVAAGYTTAEFEAIRTEIGRYDAVRSEIKLASGDYVDLKMYEPAMRHLIDTYIKGEETRKLSTFDDVSFLQLLVQKGPAAVDALPENLKTTPETVAETIENNVRKLIVDEHPINPKYYEKMSALLDALIEQRRKNSLDYQSYLSQIAELAKQVVDPAASNSHPSSIDSPGRRAMYDLVGSNETMALALDKAIRDSAQDGWRSHRFKKRRVIKAVAEVVEASLIDSVIEVAKHHDEY